MIQLRPNFSVSPLLNPMLPFPYASTNSPLGYQSPAYEIACLDATIEVGGWIEDWIASLPGRVTSYFYSKLPSLTLTGARASNPCDETPVCKIPDGSYKARCNPPTVTYLHKEGECELTARCETMFEGLPLKTTSVRYSPGAELTLQNRNGSLVKISSRDTVEDAFERIATGTGGDVTRWPSSGNFTPVMEQVFEKILKDSENAEPLDVALVLDTTQSMGPYVGEVRLNMVKFLKELQKKKDARVAILEYRDSGDSTSGFLNRVNTAFTQDLEEVQDALQKLTVFGGGDAPEAVLDALLAAKSELSWNPNAKRVVLLVGDAPPHPKTKDGRYDESQVVAQYAAANTRIAVYPVLAKR